MQIASPRHIAACALVVLFAPRVALAQVEYESVFTGYRSHREPIEAADWRGANRQAGELGGFVGVMRASASAPVPGSKKETVPSESEKIPDLNEMVSRLRAHAEKRE